MVDLIEYALEKNESNVSKNLKSGWYQDWVVLHQRNVMSLLQSSVTLRVPMPNLIEGTAVCHWCDQRHGVDKNGVMVQHNDEYPTRVCEGSNKKVPPQKVMETICDWPCEECGECHCG